MRAARMLGVRGRGLTAGMSNVTPSVLFFFLRASIFNFETELVFRDFRAISETKKN